ncbi:hypothetical protein SLE2022_205630 [Rubroshorea leprosula]
MDENLTNEKQSLLARIQHLEHERDELRKDIEQLCIQQAGPSYLAVATRMHFQRTAGLEQEIDDLKKKLAACTRDNQNLQEELSEAYRIKGQLADLHGTEAAKNIELEKQLKFFQGCVAAAFSERDQSTMEAEKAKEKEELMSQKLIEVQNRLEELMSDCVEQNKHDDALQIELARHQEQNDNLKKVIDKFYGIRQQVIGELEDISLEDKCACLLNNPAETWTLNDFSTAKYISSLEEELERLRCSVDNFRNKLRVGLEIENHLKKRVRELEKKRRASDNMMLKKITELRHCFSQHRIQIINLLEEGRSHVKWIVDDVEAKFQQFEMKGQNLGLTHCDVKLAEYKHPGVNLGMTDLTNEVERKGNASDALSQALQEKVSALLLLSQQEERHLLEKNVNAALQKKMEELQRNLLQVTNEKVKALLELAQLKEKYQSLKEKISNAMKQGNLLAETGEKRIGTNERHGRLKNLLKKSYLRHWVGTSDIGGNETEAHPSNEGNLSGRRSSSMDFAGMKIENAMLKESLESIEHLTSSVHRLRLSLLKVKESVTAEGTETSLLEALDEIIDDAKLVKTALGSSLPVSWSAEADVGLTGENAGTGSGDVYEDCSSDKIDSVSAAGFEMVELVTFAAQILKERTIAIS